MEFRCPNLSCHATFEAPLGRTGLCQQCGRLISYRTLDVWAQIDKRAQQMEAVNKLAGDQVLSSLGNLPRLFAIVEDVRSLWNVGSIFRSADGAGVGQLFLCGITGTPPRKEIAKTSLGAEDAVPWLYARSTSEILPFIKEQGATIVGLESTANVAGIPDSRPLKSYLSELPEAPVCLIVGNEVTGLTAETLLSCDAICHLPMRGMKESLNVAVAFGIAAYLIAEVACSSLVANSLEL